MKLQIWNVIKIENNVALPISAHTSEQGARDRMLREDQNQTRIHQAWHEQRKRFPTVEPEPLEFVYFMLAPPVDLED